MAPQILAGQWASAFAGLLVAILLLSILVYVLRSFLPCALIGKGKGAQPKAGKHEIEESMSELGKSLAAALPKDCVVFPHEDDDAFKKSGSSPYWAQQECEVVPACVVRPYHVRQLCQAVSILKRAYDDGVGETREVDGERQRPTRGRGLFAVRSGGHSPVPYAASIEGGVLIDLSRFCEVAVSEDTASVVIGAGAKWMDVSKVLDGKGLAVVGGRNSAVGVGGLTLGGGVLFFSPRYGMTCSNIVSYEVVLASGASATVTASANPDLWRALKGGSNNCCIVTRFTARCFPSTDIWSGFLYMPALQANKILTAFHEYVNKVEVDSHSAGRLICFSYVQAIGAQILAVNLVYTKLPEREHKWPACWRKSSFSSLWHLWSTCKVRTLTSATDETNALNPSGRRQTFATTTIKNDAATISAAHAAYKGAIAPLRGANVKGLVWTLVMQPLLPEWVRKGDANPMGLHDCDPHEPLVIVSFTVNWDEHRDDELVKGETRRTVEQVEIAAAAHGTGHRFRYLNYCADWQRPFEGYGEDNLRFLQGVSLKYDPDGLFQRGCVGGFKLWS